ATATALAATRTPTSQPVIRRGARAGGMRASRAMRMDTACGRAGSSTNRRNGWQTAGTMATDAAGPALNFEPPAELEALRADVRSLCARFPDEYWRDLQPDGYPTELVDAMTRAGHLA